MRTLTIIDTDFTYAETETGGTAVPYGSAGDCFSANTSNCRRGKFMIDLSGTGLRVADGVSWRVASNTPGFNMQDFVNHQGILIQSKCGGWCGHCAPSTSLKLDLVTCKVRPSMLFNLLPVLCITQCLILFYQIIKKLLRSNTIQI